MTDPTNDEILADLAQKGWLPGDGRVLARDDYPALYAAIRRFTGKALVAEINARRERDDRG